MLLNNWVEEKANQKFGSLSLGFSPVERRLFIAGLVTKVLVGSILASSFLTDLFVPFVTAFVENPSRLHYGHFYEIGERSAFPYPGALLFVLSIPMLPAKIFAPESQIAAIVAIRLTLLLADIAIYLTLRSWLASSRVKRLTILYWLNPVTFYISYIHGQLDVISIAFLILSMSSLFSQKNLISAVFFGLALSAKTSVALIAPVYLLYFIQREHTMKVGSQFIGIAIVSFVIVNFPFLGDPGFFQMVFQNSEQSKVLTLSLEMGEVSVYWIFVALTAITALGLKIGITNPNLFVIFAGFYFSVVLVLIPPMHGWYFWIIPFFSYFFSRETDSSPHLFVIMLGLYFVYFLLSPDSDYLQVFQLLRPEVPKLGGTHSALLDHGVNADLIRNLVFTLLQTSLFLLCIQVLRAGLLRYRLERISGKPFLLGIGGNSGVGKSTLTECVVSMFGTMNTTVLRGDDRHKWKRGSKEWKDYTHLNPKANFLHQEIDTLRELKRGKKVWRSLYDHGSGNFTESFPVVPNRMMILEGLHPFYLGDQRKLFDLRVFIEPEHQLANHWKICRDRKKRDYTVTQVLEQIQLRERDLEKFIASQRPFADLVISPRADRSIHPLGEENARFETEYDINLRNSINIEREVAILESLTGLKIEHRFEDAEHQRVTISGDLDELETRFLLKSLSGRLREVEVLSSSLPSGLYGAVAFLICSVILREAKNV